MAGAGQQLLKIFPEAQLVAGDLERVAEEQGASQAQKHLRRQPVPRRPALLGAQRLHARCTLRLAISGWSRNRAC